MANPEMMHSGNRTYSYVSLQHPDYLSDDYSCDGTAFKSFEKYSCVEEKNRFGYFIHRAHINTIVRFVYDLHMYKDRLSLESLDESNIVFHHHQLKLRGLKFVMGARVEDRARDYKLLHILLIKLLHKYNPEPEHYKRPIGVADFLSRLQQCSESKNLRSFTSHESLLANHWLLLGYKTKLAATKNFKDKASSICIPKDKTRYHTALEEMQRREDYKTGDWTKCLSGAALDCFNYETPPDKSEYVGVGEHKDVNWQILRFCRNMETHLHQYIPKRKNDPKFDMEKEKYLIIMDLFEDELMSFYHKTLQYGIAHYFIPSEELYKPEPNRCSFVEQHHTPSIANHGGGGGGGGSGNDEDWILVQHRKQKKQ